ncbi:MAG: site-2 protease family protein [Firmicutes bacterium]|nr:site-2 protease family protein [Bacillota bacterium]
MDILIFIAFIILALLILLIMITIHELGHYLAGKWLGFNINEFAIGFGPKLFSKKSKKTGEIFSIRAIPLGGFCAFEDEEGLEEDNKDKTASEGEVFSEIVNNETYELAKPKSVESIELIKTGKKFNEQPPWKRIIVLAAGGIFNLLAAVIFSMIFILAVGLPEQPIVTLFYENQAGNVLVYSYDEHGNHHYENGQRARLRSGDRIIEANGRRITYLVTIHDALQGATDEFVNFVIERPGIANPISLNLRRTVSEDSQNVTLMREDGTPVLNEDGQAITVENYQGFAFRIRNDRNQSFGAAIVWAVPYTGRMTWLVLGALGQLVTGRVPITDVTGPVGTVTQMAELSILNWRNILILLPLLSANLGIFNLLPIPALDGSKIVFASIEWIRKKPINKKVEMWIHVIGMFSLFAFVIIADLIGIFVRCGL